MSSIRDRVREIIINQLGISEEQAKDEAEFIKDLGADSLDQVELVMALEEEFSDTIPDDEVAKLTDIGKVIEYIETRQKEKAKEKDSQ